ncbi:MAG TPA: penicillin-binding protein 2 [Candidatus Eremiobacteraceae bacterium]
MRRRLLNIAAAFVVLFALLAAQEARVQLVDRAAIDERSGNPRYAQGNAARGELLDATGVPLAYSKGGKRIYPAGPALAQIVGYSSPVYGESGLEAAFDTVISPVSSGADAAGIDGLLRHQDKQTVRAGSVVLTLRRDIAAVVDAAMPAGVRGAAVVLDPRTGAVLAVVNRPTFDPNDVEKSFSGLRTRPDSPLLDRALDGLYPPGSTFKIFTASAALDRGAIDVSDTFSDPGYFQIGQYSVHNDQNEVTGTQDVTGAFALSSNVDFAQIGVKLGTDDFYAYLQRFGVGGDIGLPVPVSRDDVPPVTSISPSELAQMAFGQGGLTVTPMRMALIASAIANRGTMMRPMLLKEIRIPGRPPLRIPASVWGRPVSSDTADEVRSMMEAVVRYGTGTAAALPSVTVAGKTGTGTHNGAPPDAWFVCFAPAEAPRLAVAVLVEDAGYGGAVSAPIARAILQGSLPLYPR